MAFVLCLVWGHRRPPVARLLGAALVSEAIVGPFVHLRAMLGHKAVGKTRVASAAYRCVWRACWWAVLAGRAPYALWFTWWCWNDGAAAAAVTESVPGATTGPVRWLAFASIVYGLAAFHVFNLLGVVALLKTAAKEKGRERRDPAWVRIVEQRCQYVYKDTKPADARGRAQSPVGVQNTVVAPKKAARKRPRMKN